MRNRKHARGLSLLLCAVLLAGQLGTTIYAEGTASDTEGLCEHHPEHTTECGYVEAVEGHRCEHVHTDGCYTDELICGYDDEDMELATDSDAAHEHTPKCYKLDCPHERGEHDEDCGYVEAVKGQPCSFVCDECGKEPEADNENNPPAPELPEPDHKQSEEAEVFTITDFDGLDEAVQYQTVSPGTKLDEINLPATLRASGYKVNDAEGGREGPLEGMVTDNTEPTSEPITIQGVTWEPDEAYDDTAEQGGYIFTPVLPDGYTRATGVELPEIYVRIGEANVTLDVQGDVLTVNFDDNGSGGTRDSDNDMKTAIDAALSTLSSGGQTSVTTIKLTGGVTEITGYNWKYLLERYHADSGWDSLTALDLSGMAGLEAVRNDIGSVRQIYKLQTLTLPDGLNQIGSRAFYGCKNLALQELPDGLNQIGDNAFFNCKSLALQTLPDGLNQIGNNAFTHCESLALQTLPDGLKQIGNNAFYSCESLALQTLPDGLKQIGKGAFSYCESLTSLTIPASVESIGDSAFYGCTNLTKVTFEGATAPTFGERIFDGITPQPTVFVPKGATGYEIFSPQVTGVLSVNFDSNGSGGTSENNNDMKTAIDAALSTLPPGDQTSVITIKLTGGATEITLYNWRYLLERYHKDSGWDSLTTLDLSGMTSLEEIQGVNLANYQITKLQTLILPGDLTQIGMNAFSGCENLALQALPVGLEQIGDSAFNGCTNLALQSLPDGLTQIGGSAFFGCGSLALQSLPGSLTQIGGSAFNGCTNLALQSLPDGLTRIEADAFSGCENLALQVLPDGLEQIGKYAFYGCESLALESLPSKLTQIGKAAFFGCKSLALESLPGSLKQIGDGAFSGCENLALQSLPDGLNQIGDKAFSGCTSLDKIIMEPTTAPTLGTGAFENTSSGLTFYVPRGGTGYNSGGWENLNTVEYTPITSISLPPMLELRPHGSGTLTPTFIPGDARFKEIIWESSDTNIVTVDQDGKVNAVSNGTATITATSRQGRKTATCAVTVKDAPPVTIPVTDVKLNYSAYTLHTDKDPRSFQLVATVGPADASNKAVSWQSSDTNIATVDASGNVTAVKEGTATITVITKDGSKKASCVVTVETDSSGGGGGGGDNDNNSRSYVTITTPKPPQPDSPVLAVIETPITVGNGTATGTTNDGSTSEAITRALNTAKQKGREKYGIAVQYDATTTAAYDGFSITIKRATLDHLLDPNNGVKYLTLNTSVVDLTFDLAALNEIAKQSTGDITLTATREKAVTGDLLAAVGTRPAYRLAVGYTGQDGKAATVQNFGAGSVSVGLAYTPAENEQAGGLYLVYGDDNGGVTWYYRSSYDKGSGNVIASTGHFSVYGVGYKPAPAFTDTAGHWAKADIDFAASRGLLTGTGDATFSPDVTISRGMFVTALGRLAGIDPAAYASSSWFSDVPATDYYAPFVEWAASKGIVNGTGANTFEPGRAVTREEMAVIMRRYADKLGYTLPVAREAEIFADDAKITSSMKDAVQAMQQAGVMNGKGGHLFAPKDTATRAEAAAVLRRFVEVVINRDTADGWTQNDAGGWLYYENNKPVTGWKQLENKWYYFDAAGLMQSGGWKQISGKWYYFYADGSMAANTEIDGYQIGPDGARNS
ncbi:Putative cell wall binding repeat-containing protein [Lachnospiraceae bacterium NLAE-zl-G231]|nr:Putative cell wall binding repeat-containing protein [Lachnospiraceae bacterium NLAE-zl-G231]